MPFGFLSEGGLIEDGADVETFAQLVSMCDLRLSLLQSLRGTIIMITFVRRKRDKLVFEIK